VPPDWPPLNQNFISKGAVIIFFVLSSILVMICLLLIVLVTLQRGVVIIQHSGYPYLVCILLGSTGLACSVFVFGSDLRYVSWETQQRLCMFQVWLVGLSFVVLFGPLMLKSVRILWITNQPSLSTTKYLDEKIFGFYFLFLIGEIIILILWTTIDPLSIKQNLSDDLLSVTYSCESNAVTFTIIWIVYKGVLLFLGIFVAYFSRNMESRFNESKTIGLCIYNIVILSAIIIPVAIVNQKQPTISFVVKSIGVICISLGCIILFFGNKLLIVTNLVSGSSSSQTFKSSAVNTTTTNNK